MKSKILAIILFVIPFICNSKDINGIELEEISGSACYFVDGCYYDIYYSFDWPKSTPSGDVDKLQSALYGSFGADGVHSNANNFLDAIWGARNRIESVPEYNGENFITDVCYYIRVCSGPDACVCFKTFVDEEGRGGSLHAAQFDTKYVNFDTQSGKIITLNDVFSKKGRIPVSLLKHSTIEDRKLCKNFELEIASFALYKDSIHFYYEADMLELVERSITVPSNVLVSAMSDYGKNLYDLVQKKEKPFYINDTFIPRRYGVKGLNEAMRENGVPEDLTSTGLVKWKNGNVTDLNGNDFFDFSTYNRVMLCNGEEYSKNPEFLRRPRTPESIPIYNFEGEIILDDAVSDKAVRQFVEGKIDRYSTEIGLFNRLVVLKESLFNDENVFGVYSVEGQEIVPLGTSWEDCYRILLSYKGSDEIKSNIKLMLKYGCSNSDRDVDFSKGYIFENKNGLYDIIDIEKAKYIARGIPSNEKDSIAACDWFSNYCIFNKDKTPLPEFEEILKTLDKRYNLLVDMGIYSKVRTMNNLYFCASTEGKEDHMLDLDGETVLVAEKIHSGFTWENPKVMFVKKSQGKSFFISYDENPMNDQYIPGYQYRDFICIGFLPEIPQITRNKSILSGENDNKSILESNAKRKTAEEDARRKAEEYAKKKAAQNLVKGAFIKSNANSLSQSNGVYGKYDLGGRGILGSLSKPTVNTSQSGTVVVKITVNPSGVVVAAEITSGTTTANQELRRAATEAAFRARFKTAQGKENVTGTITYCFN